MKKHLLLMFLLAAISLICAVPREMVVIEIATGTWCPYCPGASMGAHDLIEAGYNVAVVKNHNGDSYANTYSNSRNNYYGASSYPTTFFDGLNPYEGGSNTQSLYPVYVPRVNARLSIPSKYTISAEGSLEGGILSIDVTVSKPEADSNTNVYLRSYLTESNIQQNWQGQTELDYVNRLMAPSAQGIPINLATGESTTQTLSFNLNTLWDKHYLELVLFLQNNNTREILQGTKYSVPLLINAFPVSDNILNFPDTYIGGYSTLPITFYNYGDTPIESAIAIDNPDFLSDLTFLSIPPLSSNTLNVMFTPSSAGESTGTLTVNGDFLGYPQIEIPLLGTSFTNTPPIVEDVAVTGPPVIHQILSGSYSFSDPDMDEEGESIYEWYKVINGNNYIIPNANESTYQVAASDINRQIAFKVTPIDQHGMAGTPVFSEPSLRIVSLPAPQNFSGVVEPPNSAILSWEKPMYFDSRGLAGYIIFRDDLNIDTIPDPNILTYTDSNLPDGIYEYKIVSMFSSPNMQSLPAPAVVLEIDASDNEDLVSAIQNVISAYPNPFRSNADFNIKAAPNRMINFSVYNLKGQQVKQWTSISDAQGNAIINWDGKDSSGNISNSGVYLYRMDCDGKTVSGKIIRLSH